MTRSTGTIAVRMKVIFMMTLLVLVLDKGPVRIADGLVSRDQRCRANPAVSDRGFIQAVAHSVVDGVVFDQQNLAVALVGGNSVEFFGVDVVNVEAPGVNRSFVPCVLEPHCHIRPPATLLASPLRSACAFSEGRASGGLIGAILRILGLPQLFLYDLVDRNVAPEFPQAAASGEDVPGLVRLSEREGTIPRIVVGESDNENLGIVDDSIGTVIRRFSPESAWNLKVERDVRVHHAAGKDAHSINCSPDTISRNNVPGPGKSIRDNISHFKRLDVGKALVTRHQRV